MDLTGRKRKINIRQCILSSTDQEQLSHLATRSVCLVSTDVNREKILMTLHTTAFSRQSLRYSLIQIRSQ
jgi:hypothetical protein